MAELSSNIVARRKRAPLTREERSIIRILLSYGVSRIAIAKRVQCCTSTITNISKSSSNTSARDDGNDWDFVDDDFRKAYPPLKLEDTKEPIVKRDHSTKRSPSATVAVIETAERPASDQHTASGSFTRITPKDPGPPGSASRRKQARPYALRPAGPSRHHAITVDLESSPEPELQEIQPPLPDLHQFLASLEHNLSGIIDVLTEQDLGTSEKLFALATWPEDELHRLFKEAVPQLTVAQRFMLVKGMKKSVEQ